MPGEFPRGSYNDLSRCLYLATVSVEANCEFESHDSNNHTVAVHKKKPGKIKKQVSFHEDVRVRYIATEVMHSRNSWNLSIVFQRFRYLPQKPMDWLSPNWILSHITPLRFKTQPESCHLLVLVQCSFPSLHPVYCDRILWMQ